MDVNNIQFTRIEIRIAKFMFKHFKERYNSRQLANVLDINHAHANKLCNSLNEKGILFREEIGNSVYFSYNYDNAMAVKFANYLFSLEERGFPKWLAVVMHGLEKFKPFIKMGLVFGSSVQHKDFNDIDVLLMYDKSKTHDIERIKNEIRKSHLIEKPIRYLEITEKDIVLNKEDKIFYNILSNNLVFYNSDKYLEVIANCLK
ncbi:MAG: hypothetical protein AABX11_06660 [Nanoarchaeota archaeon]